MHLLFVAIEQRPADFVDSWCSALVNLLIPMCTMSLQVSRAMQPLGHHSRTPRSRVFLVCGYYHLAPCQPQVFQILQQAPTSNSRLLLLRRLSISQKSQRQLNSNVQIPVWVKERASPQLWAPSIAMVKTRKDGIDFRVQQWPMLVQYFKLQWALGHVSFHLIFACWATKGIMVFLETCHRWRHYDSRLQCQKMAGPDSKHRFPETMMIFTDSALVHTLYTPSGKWPI